MKNRTLIVILCVLVSLNSISILLLAFPRVDTQKVWSLLNSSQHGKYEQVSNEETISKINKTYTEQELVAMNKEDCIDIILLYQSLISPGKNTFKNKNITPIKK